MNSDRELIEKCLQKDPLSQELLYRRYAPKMYGICQRYVSNRDEAQDILQEGFIKVFTNLEKFRYQGSFEGWIRRTIVNTAINYYRKNLKHFQDVGVEEVDLHENLDKEIVSRMSAKEMMKMIQSLPEGYRLVFNLYALEGFSHKEIAGMLGISENTSKSQLSRARNILQKKIKKNYLMYEKTA